MTVPAEGALEQMAQGLLGAVELLVVQAEAAAGYRTRLEGMGWSPVIAEQIAAQLVVQMNRLAINPPKQPR